jgi:hypothetical protein
MGEIKDIMTWAGRKMSPSDTILLKKVIYE